jgi:monoterpene epsilon-lactone hydrolase
LRGINDFQSLNGLEDLPVSRKILFPLSLIVFASLLAWSEPNQSIPQDSATFDPDGIAHITRTVPMPTTISPEAQKWLASLAQSTPGPEDLATRRKRTDEWRVKQSAAARLHFPVNVEETTTAGVRTDIITPLQTPAANRDRVLINLHGGGFNSDSGSLIEGVPIANLTKIKVVSVYYRLAPENPFPAPVDDTVAVYKELLKTYKPGNIGIFGTSAGAILTAEVAVRLKQLNLPLPAALGLFSVLADYSRTPDSHELFTLNGFPGALKPQDPNSLAGSDEYARTTDRRDPVLSPIFADLTGMPPSLLVTSTRDLLLSDTALFHRALLRAGDDAQLIVFEALPHAFWYHFQLPETTEALNLMSNFFLTHMGPQARGASPLTTILHPSMEPFFSPTVS